MSSKKQDPQGFEKFINRLMLVKPRIDPRKSEKPIFASFQDRLFASALDVGVIFIMFQDLLAWISWNIYQQVDETIEMTVPENMRNAPAMEQFDFFVNQAFTSGFAQLWLLNSFIQSVIMGTLLVAVWVHFHTTPGKFIVGVKLAGKHGQGEPSLHDYIRRYLGFYLSMPPLMLGFALLGFDKEKRAWHDRVAGTTVIYTKEGNIFRRAWDLIKAQFKRKN